MSDENLNDLNGLTTKGEVHWVISYDNEADCHYVECPTTPLLDMTEDEILNGREWTMKVLHTGTFSECVEWIYALARMESEWENEARQENEAEGGTRGA